MSKLFLAFIISSSIAFASIINGIAITVNDDPITIYDIEKTSQKNKIDKNEAVSLLIDKLLYDQLVKKHNISADIFDVNDYIEKLAAINNMDVYTFKSIIKQKYPDYSLFEKEAKNSVIKEKLIEKIIKGKLNIASEEDMQLYYKNHKERFITASTFEVVKYTSKNKSSLYNTLKNPLFVSEDVNRESESLNANDIEPKLQYLLTQTNVNSFTPIFTYDKKFTSLFITKKVGQNVLPYETVKSKIFNDVMKLREKKYLKEYFEKQKLTADIKIVR